MKRVRNWLFWPVVLVCTILIIPPLLINKLLFRSSRFASWVNRQWGRAAIWASGVELTINGSAESKGPFVVVMNHVSTLDIPVALVALKGVDFRFAAKRILFWIPILGWAMYFGGHLPLDRADPKRGLQILLDSNRRGRRHSLLVYPEGSRSPDGEIMEFKGGAFLIAIDHELPILPVVTVGLEKAMNKKARQPKPLEVSVLIGQSISTKGRTRRETRRLMKETEAWMTEVIHGSR